VAPSGSSHFILYGYHGSTPVLRIDFRNSSGVYQLRAGLTNDSTSFSTTSYFNISDGPHFIEIDWQAATSPTALNGSVALWIDGALQGSRTGMDNDTRRIDSVRLGAVESIDSGTSGVYYFDAFESRKQTAIGPASGIASGIPGAGEIYLPLISR
jgi:hypothetical protein